MMLPDQQTFNKCLSEFKQTANDAQRSIIDQILLLGPVDGLIKRLIEQGYDPSLVRSTLAEAVKYKIKHLPVHTIAQHMVD